MPATAKMRRISQIQIRETGKPPKTFSVTKEILSQVHQLLTGPQWVAAESVLPSLKNQSAPSVLRGLRHRDQLTQVELAQMIEVTQGDISKMEKGERSIGKDIARRLAKAFNVDYRLFL